MSHPIGDGTYRQLCADHLCVECREEARLSWARTLRLLTAFPDDDVYFHVGGHMPYYRPRHPENESYTEHAWLGYVIWLFIIIGALGVIQWIAQ